MLSSAEIAAQAMMHYQQFSLMQSSFGRQDAAAGHALNAMAGGAPPLLGGALGALGMDPLSLGLSAGMQAFSGGGIFGAMTGGAGLGLAGSAGVATAVAAPLAIGGLAAGYAGNQMMVGAQQQQALNARLAQSFNFQNSSGRRGFTRSDTSQIGAAMREMSHDVGPGGELTSMRELTDLAGKMGQMGMGKGVRDAQEFNTKFREMIKTVKTIATEMNTSLSQAAEFMHASKSSGMFRQSDQMRFSQQIQGTAASSGLATSEVSAMGSIGAQISRAYGGLGQQGAMGGVRAIGQVGAAIQTGALSEENIYNATGLTGAEGRQAMASNMMSQTGSFLRTGKGRWFLASMAGKNGAIDENVVQQYMSGAMGVGDTRAAAGSHLGEVGRANFIRNEGRLRGAVMERFGALAPAIALSGWASQRGIDVNEMDDRSMLFAQRQLGMGRDEMDVAVKMAKNLPKILQSQNQQADLAGYSQKIGDLEKSHGVEGAKRRFEHAKEKLNSGLQQAGSDMYTELTNVVDGWLNSFLGTAVPAVTANLHEVFRDTINGGASGQLRYEAVFGGGKVGQKLSDVARITKGMKTSAGGALGAESMRMTWEEFNPSGLSSVGGLFSGAGETQKKLRDAGYGGRIDAIDDVDMLGTLKGGRGKGLRVKEKAAEKQQALHALLAEANSTQIAISGSGSVGTSGALRSKLLAGYASGVAATGMGDRAGALEALLEKEASAGDEEARKHLEKMRDMKDPAARAKYAASVETGMGLKGSTALTSMADKMGSLDSDLMTRMRGAATQADRDAAAGSLLSGKEADSLGSSMLKGALIGGIGGSAFMAVGAIPGAVLGGLGGAAKYLFGDGKEVTRENRALAESMRSEKSMALVAGVITGDSKAMDEATRAVGDGHSAAATTEEKTRATIARTALLTSDALKKGKPLSEYTAEEKAAVVARSKDLGGSTDFDTIAGAIQFTGSELSAIQKRNSAEGREMLRSSSAAETTRAVSVGVLKRGEDGTISLSAGSEGLTGTAKEAVDAFSGALQVGTGAEDVQSVDPSAVNDAYRSRMAKHEQAVEKMSLSELRSYVKTTRGAAGGTVQLAMASQYESARKKGGAAEGIASMFGVDMSKEQRKALKAAWAKGSDEFLHELSASSGLTGLEQNDNVKKMIAEAQKKGGSSVAIGSYAEKALKDPAMREQLEKKEDAKRSPQDKLAKEMSNLTEALKGQKIGESIKGGMTDGLKEVAAAIEKINHP